MRAARLAVVSLSLLAPSLARAQQPLTVVGSTTVRPIVDKLLPAFRKANPAVTVRVDSGGSALGIAAVGKGDASIAMTSRGPRAAEQQAFPKLVFHRIGVDGVSIVVHRSNPVRGLTTEQLRSIYLGRITDWKQFGGDGQIVPFVATTKHGTFQSFAEFLQLEGQESADHATVTLRGKGATGDGFAVTAIDGTRAMLGGIVANHNAIACVSTGATNAMAMRGAAMTTLALDGVDATEANLLSGKYTFQRPLYLVTNGPPQRATKALVELVLGVEGQLAVRALDFVPVRSASLATPGR